LFIPDNVIEEIRDKTDIVDVVSHYVELKRSGSNYKALCPFHDEKTPSFMVSPEKQIYHCFGCGKGGNVFGFVMEMEGVSFPEAVKTLGEECGVKVSFSPGAGKDEGRNEALYRANEFAAEWYGNVLRGRRGAPVRDYLQRRGISEESVERFKLGLAPEGWDGLFKAARNKGLPLEVLKELKLVVAREGGGYYDYFRKRLMFPIVSLSGRTIAFGARSLSKSVEPKYLNSVESPIFKKRRTFFGINHAREAVRNRKAAILVEGYTDCIALHQAGFTNCMATCGTALTEEHARVLRRLTSAAVLLPDGDAAGLSGAVAAGAQLLAQNLSVKVALLEDGEDPDTLAFKKGEEGVSATVGRAMDYFAFLSYLVKHRMTSLGEREALLRRVLEGVSRASDKIHKEMILEELSRVFAVGIEALMEKARRSGRRTPDTKRAGEEDKHGKAEDLDRVRLEKTTLRLMMESPDLAREASSRLDYDDFHQDSCAELYKLLDSALEKHIDLGSKEFQRLSEDAGMAGLAAEIALISIPPGDSTKLLKDYIKRMKEFKIRDELRVLSEKLRRLPEESDEAVAVAEYYNRLKIALSQL
jgi:DNA primase